MTDRPAAGTNAAEGNWRWSDGSAVDFLAWTPGEPNNWRVAGSVSGGSAYNAGYEGGSVNMGEDVVAVTFAVAKYPGGWNDEHGESAQVNFVPALHCLRSLRCCRIPGRWQ